MPGILQRFVPIHHFFQTSRGKNWLKVVLVLAFSSLLYFTITGDDDLISTKETFLQNLNRQNSPFLLAVLILMPLNWWLECLKWQRVLVPVHRLGIIDSLRSVLIGVSSSIFTPNRIGEFIGRVIVLPNVKRWQGAAALLLLSFAQLGTLAILGTVSLLYLNHSLQLLEVKGELSITLILIILSALIGCIIYTPRLYAGIRWSGSNKWKQKLQHLLGFITQLNQKLWMEICGLTFTRIIVYVIQYLLLLRFYGIGVPWYLAMAVILVTYLAQSSIPLPPLISLLARGEIALILWKFYSVNELSVLAASYSLWVINVLMPALVGMVFVVRIKQLKTVNHAVGKVEHFM